MKKEYTEPEHEFIEFKNEIIRTSSGTPTDDGTSEYVEYCGCRVDYGFTFAQ